VSTAPRFNRLSFDCEEEETAAVQDRNCSVEQHGDAALVWGAMTGPDQLLSPEALAFLDRLAALTLMPDAAFAELRALYQGDNRLRVPATVYNAVLNRNEAVS
jgi:hypothetical protein